MQFEKCHLEFTFREQTDEVQATCLWIFNPAGISGAKQVHFDCRTSTLKVLSVEVTPADNRKKKLPVKHFTSRLASVAPTEQNETQRTAKRSAKEPQGKKKGPLATKKEKRNVPANINSNNNANTQKQLYSQPPNLLTCSCEEGFVQGTRYAIQINYTCTIRSDGFGIYKCLPLTGSSALQDGPLVLTHFEPVFASVAFPFPNPNRVPDNQDDHHSWVRAAYSLSVAIPLSCVHVSVYANNCAASVVEKSGCSIYSFPATPPIPPYLFAFALSVFEEQHLEVVLAQKTISCKILVPKMVYSRSFAAQLIKELQQALPLCTTTIEKFFQLPLPCEKLDVMIAPYHVLTGMENYQLIFLNVREKEGEFALSKMKEDLLHEVIHQVQSKWIGNFIGMSLFCKEGIVQYVENLYKEKLFGKKAEKKKAPVVKSQNLSSAHFLEPNALDPESAALCREFHEQQNEDIYQKALKELEVQLSQLGQEAFANIWKNAMLKHPWGFLTNEQVLQLLGCSNEK